MTSASLVPVGAVHWDHAAWRGSFYPEGLPDDWMLSYYNTQFQAVWLPASTWQAASAATWGQWLDDTQESFSFVLEPGQGGATPPDSPRVVLATPDWVDTHVWWIDEAPDLRALAQRITEQARRGEPLFVFSRGGDVALLEQVNTLKQVMGY